MVTQFLTGTHPPRTIIERGDIDAGEGTRVAITFDFLTLSMRVGGYDMEMMIPIDLILQEIAREQKGRAS